MANKVQIIEVGLRDGLQNEKTILDLPTRLEFALKLAASGLKRIEIGAFVHPKWVPQMANSGALIKEAFALQEKGKFPSDVQFSALVPNEFGMREALGSGLKEVAVFAACSESFSKKNLNCTIEESFARFEPVFALAKENKIKVRGYLSTCFGCPFEGTVPEARVTSLTKKLLTMGAYEVSIGDTIGVANPRQVRSIFKKLLKLAPAKKLAGHFHDTRGLAVTNALAAYELGVRAFDSSLGGLGGCPYAPNATGNGSTEDMVYMFESMGIKTGVDLGQLIETNRWMAPLIKHSLPSRVGSAGLFRPKNIRA